MTDRQALTEARKRWGKGAMVKRSASRHLGADAHGRDGKARLVGHVALGLFFEVHGIGPNWVAAFEAADRAAAAQRASAASLGRF